MLELSPVLLIAIPLLTAFLIPLLSLIYREIGKILLPLLMLALFIMSLYFIPSVMEKGVIVEEIVLKAPFGINLVVGAFGLFLTLIISGAGFLISLYSFKYSKDMGIEPVSRYSILFILIVMGAIGIVLTGDIFNLFVFVEIMSISAYSLSAIKKDKFSLESAIKYLIIGSISSVFILTGIALIYSHTGSLTLAVIAQKFSAIDPIVSVFIFILFIIGFGVEAELFPLNFWAPDVYTSSPSNITAIFSGISVKAGIYALIRFLYLIYTYDERSRLFLIIIALITLIIAEILAFRQEDLKRMLAYSSIGQVGLIVLAFVVGTSSAVEGALFHLLNHSLIKIMLFLIAGYFALRTGSTRIKDLRGIGTKMPISVVFFVIGSLAVMGFPPLNGFVSKIMILKAMGDIRMIAPIIFVLIASLIEVAYYFKAVQVFYTKDDTASVSDDNKVKEAPIIALIPIFILGIVIIMLGIFPELVTGLIEKAGKELLDKSMYIIKVLKGAV